MTCNCYRPDRNCEKCHSTKNEFPNGLVNEGTYLIDYEPIPDNSDLMTMAEFVEFCRKGGAMDCDGVGRYATKDQMTSVEIYPSDIATHKKIMNFSHVVWFFE